MKNNWWIKIPVAFFLVLGLTEYMVDSGEMPAFIENRMVQAFLVFVLVLLIAIALIINAIENVMFQTLSEEGKKRYLDSKSKGWEWSWGKKTYKKLLGSKPVEEEGEIILGSQLRWHSRIGQQFTTMVGIYVLRYHNFWCYLFGALPHFQ